MAVSTLSPSLPSANLSASFRHTILNLPQSTSPLRTAAFFPQKFVKCSRQASYSDERDYNRRSLLLGAGTIALSLFSSKSLLAEEVPKNYEAFVDLKDGYSYYFPSDWIDFDFRGHDSAFKDRYLQLQNVRLSFIPTNKSDIHDMGPMEEVVTRLVKHVYAAPNQIPTILDMQEKNIDGKNYYIFEYVLQSRGFARTAFANIAVGNGRYYTLVVGANDRRWRRVRNKLKVVADSFRVLDI